MDGRSLRGANDSAEQIDALIYETIRALPSLERVTVQVVRLPVPDANGCNGLAKHSVLPAHLPACAARVLFDIIAKTRRHFNLCDVH